MFFKREAIKRRFPQKFLSNNYSIKFILYYQLLNYIVINLYKSFKKKSKLYIHEKLSKIEEARNLNLFAKKV